MNISLENGYKAKIFMPDKVFSYKRKKKLGNFRKIFQKGIDKDIDL